MPEVRATCDECDNVEKVEISVVDTVKKLRHVFDDGDEKLKCKECGHVQENIPNVDEEFDSFEWL